MSILVKKFPKISILVKIFENNDFGENCLKIINLDKFDEKIDFGQNCRKISILVKI